MNELVVIDPDGNVRRFSLSFEELSIGRDPKNQILLDDPRVSRTHARVYRGEKGHYIEDLGSANGVLLDGSLIRSPSLIGIGAKLEIGGFVFTVVPEGSAHPSLDKRAPKLKGLSGAHKGQEFALTGGRVTVGRVEGNQIVVDDPSVSRHHARVQRDGRRWMLHDLGSSNGTFVGGRPVTQRELKHGDKVAFGSVHFRFVATGGKSRGAGLPPPIMYALAGGLVLIAAGVALALVLRPKPSPGADDVSVAARHDVTLAMSLGKAAMQREEWDEAIRQFDRVLGRDLSHADAKLLRSQAQDSNVHKQLLVSAESALARGDKVAAIASLSRVPGNSPYSDRAGRVAAKISEAQRNEARGQRRDFALTADEEKQLRGRYSNPKTLDAVLLYLKGDFDGSVTALGKNQKGKGSDANAPTILKNVRSVRTKQADGAVASQAGDVEKALREWDAALQADLLLVPEAVRSQPRSDVLRMMGDSLYRAGYHQFIRGNYAEAFAYWKRGADKSPDNVDILQGFMRLETIAESIFGEAERLLGKDQARACTRLREAIALTREAAPTHAKALAMLGDKCRP